MEIEDEGARVDMLFVGGGTVEVTAQHIEIAKRLYAIRPFVMGSTATTHGATIGRAFDWDGAPAYYQSDMLELAHAVISPALPNTRPAALDRHGGEGFQARVQPWMMECFGAEIAADRIERNHRFLEEALELVQSLGCTRSEAHQLVDYTFDRAEGEPMQEVGGVMVTLAALCLAAEMDMHRCGDAELARISAPETIAKIRDKQAAKPKHSPLPALTPEDAR